MLIRSTSLLLAAALLVGGCGRRANPAWAALGPQGAGQVVLVERDAQGCGRPAVVLSSGTLALLRAAAPGLCVRQALTARLEASSDTEHVVVRVGPAAAGASERIFVYERRGLQLQPRFLGSGPPWGHLLSLAAGPRGRELTVRVLDQRVGSELELRCALEQFPLVCHPVESGDAEEHP